jgi:hypothetical protein
MRVIGSESVVQGLELSYGIIPSIGYLITPSTGGPERVTRG